MLLQVQMSNNHVQKIIDDDSYEILELNASEPIIDDMYIAPSIVSIDPVTAVLSAQRLSKIKFDRLLMSHQDSPLVERARETVEQLVSNTIEQIKSNNNA